jgi:hypothetical protein
MKDKLKEMYKATEEQRKERVKWYNSLTPTEKGKLDFWIDSFGYINFKCCIIPVLSPLCNHNSPNQTKNQESNPTGQDLKDL